MSNEIERAKRELEAAQHALAEAEARYARLEANHRGTAVKEVAHTNRHIKQNDLEWMQALDVVNDPIFLHDREFRVLRCNKAYQQQAGIPFKQIIGQPYYEVFPKTHAPLHGCENAIEQTQNTIEKVVNEVMAGDRSFRARAFTIHDEQGVYLYSIHILEDISERKQAEKALKESEERLRLSTASARDAIILLEAEHGSIVQWNPAAETIFGYTQAEALGRAGHDLLAPTRFRETARLGLARFAASGEGAAVGKTLELQALHKNGSEFPIELSLSAMQLQGKWYATAFVRDISARKQAMFALNHANRALATLGTVNRQLVYSATENQLLQSICQAIVEQRGYRMAIVGYAQDNADKPIKIVAHAYESGDSQDGSSCQDAEHGMETTGCAFSSGKTQVCQDITSNSVKLPCLDFALQHGYASCISLPMRDAENVVFGVLTVFSNEKDTFIPAEVDLLEEMAGDMAFGVRTLRMRQERDRAMEQVQSQLLKLENNLEDTVKAIASIVELRDPYTAGHQARVADLAVAIAKQMALPDEQVHGIYLAGVVHDLGKIQIPAEILSSPIRLNDIEYSLIKTHSQAGYDILKDIDFSWPVAQTVLQHHERIDGSGYPRGLKGDEILLEARILCVADVVEAMASHRPYRPGLGIDVALNEINKGKATLYDPAVVDACQKVFDEGLFKL